MKTEASQNEFEVNYKMQKIKKITKYFVPALFVLVIIATLAVSVMYIRAYMMKQTVLERSSQLEEMISQIKTNMDIGLETHWNLVAGIKSSTEGKYYNDEQELVEDIGRLEKEFCTDLYGCQVMFLDTMGTAYLAEGDMGIWDDIGRLADGEERHTFVSDTSNVNGTFLAFTQKLSQPIIVGEDEIRFTHLVLLKDIEALKKYYTTESYGGNAATYIIKENGTLAYYDAQNDLFGVKNIFKALANAEYVQERSFEEIKEQLNSKGVVATNIMIDQIEYYYCLTTLSSSDMTLMLLIPAEYVAASTMNIMNSTIRVVIIIMMLMVVLIVLALISIIKVQRSSQLVKIEQKNNEELNKLRLAAEEAMIAAESASKAKSTFLSNMSHDIRTPMNAIIGFTNIGLKQNPTPELKNCLEKISNSSEHLLTLINDVLDISRIESGKIKYTPLPIDIREVTDTVLNIMHGFLSNRNINFRTRRTRIETPYVLADAVRIREVLVNILGNAVKFTDDGGRIIFEMNYHPWEDDKHIVVCYRISDTGVGMSEEFVEHIFDEFSQEENSARTQYKGTGLGMAITKRYVDLMGGTISVESKKNEGSTFTIEIPFELTDESEVRKQGIPASKADLTGVKILMAEDNELNAEIAMVQLEEAGIQVTRASDGKEVVKIFAENPPGTFDIILMDVMMPEMNGYEATKAIRSMNNRHDDSNIPIIAMTANAFAEDVQASLDAGMNGHIAKPINIDELIKAIARNVNR
ncbi:MAG: ATP-binding protein [Agathobacter sp.]|nr:ATP-binding protein [Agathobacter sp.]